MTFRTIAAQRQVAVKLLCSFMLLAAYAPRSYGQEEIHIYADSTAQIIRGFGAANIVGWRPDMTDEEIETAFGVGDGMLGFSLLRVRIPPDQNQWSVNLPTTRRAHDMGVGLIASPWSPPANMKTNGSLVGGRLRDDMYAEYAEYLDDFNSFMQANDAPLYAVSVQNEPDIEVTYESCDWSPEEMTRFMRENASMINTRVIAPESFQFRRAMSDPILNDPEAAANLDIVGGHIYGGGLSPYPLAEEKGKEVWMSEHLVLETDLDANIATAVEIQNVMKAGMSAYIWWYIVRFYGPISDGEEAPYRKGEITKRGYVMSQFSRFVRPGAVRVHTARPGPFSSVSTTAYRDSTHLVIVAVNSAQSSRDVRFTLDGGSFEGGRRHVTSESEDVQQLDDLDLTDDAFTVTLGAKSVTTFVLDHATVSSTDVSGPPLSLRLAQNHPNPFAEATSISYTLERTEEVRLEVFDLLGRRVARLVDGPVAEGTHRVEFVVGQLPAGVYIYQLRAGESVQTRQMTVIR